VILNELPEDLSVVRLFGGGDEPLCSVAAGQLLSVGFEGSCAVKSAMEVVLKSDAREGTETFVLCFVVSVPEDEPPSIVFSSTADIQRIHLNGYSFPGNSSLAPLQTLALEFSHRNRSLCFVQHKSSNAKLTCANIDNLNDSWDLPTPTMFPLDCEYKLKFKVSG
jgi:hypothetical protein